MEEVGGPQYSRNWIVRNQGWIIGWIIYSVMIIFITAVSQSIKWYVGILFILGGILIFVLLRHFYLLARDKVEISEEGKEIVGALILEEIALDLFYYNECKDIVKGKENDFYYYDNELQTVGETNNKFRVIEAVDEDGIGHHLIIDAEKQPFHLKLAELIDKKNKGRVYRSILKNNVQFNVITGLKLQFPETWVDELRKRIELFAHNPIRKVIERSENIDLLTGKTFKHEKETPVKENKPLEQEDQERKI